MTAHHSKRAHLDWGGVTFRGERREGGEANFRETVLQDLSEVLSGALSWLEDFVEQVEGGWRM